MFSRVVVWKYFGHRYGNMATKGLTDFYQKVAEEITMEIECGNILDAGTGPGYLPIEIAERSGNIRVTQPDISKKMIGPS